MVCSVESTRWPVSAAVSAISMVSRSRISPTRITFGACRSAALSAAAKVGVSLCSSRWWMVAFLCWCRNSIGSSMVRMCSARVSLIRSMIAASVDDLPEPVGPVTSTMPFFSAALSASDRRQLELGERRNPRRDDAHDDRERAALPEDVDAEAAAFGQRVGQIAGALLLERAQRRLVAAHQIAGDARRVLGAEHAAAAARPPPSGGRAFRPAARGPGENTRSLMPLPESSIAPIRCCVRDRRRCRGRLVGGSGRTPGASVVILCRLTYRRPDELACRTDRRRLVRNREYDAHRGRRLASMPVRNKR